MKLNIFISMLLLSFAQPSLHAMAEHKENVKKLGKWLADSGSDEKKGTESMLAIVALDSPKAKRSSGEVDPISQKMAQQIIDQQKEVRFYTFLLNYKKKARYILQDYEETKDELIREYVSKLKLEEIKNNKNEHADKAQKKIDDYYLEKYNTLYKKMYADEYETQAPENVVTAHSRQAYFEQINEGCCVIL